MKKLFKFIFKLILFLVLLVLILVGVLLFLLSDGSKNSFTPSEESISMENVIGDGIYSSLDRIQAIDNSSRSTSDENYLGVYLTTEDMNNIVVDVIRKNSNLNPNYMKNGDTNGIISTTGVSLDSILFEEVDGKLAVKARVTALGFYHSSVTLSGTPSLDGKVLKIAFQDFKLGKRMTIKRSFVLSVMDKLSLSFNGSSNFDANTLTLSFDVSDMIESYTNSSRFSDIFENCTYAVDYVKATDTTEGSVVLKVDTKNVFTPVTEIGKASSSFTFPTVDVMNPTPTATISEADFNKLIETQLTDKNIADPITLGNKTFTFTLDGLFYNLDTDQIQAILSINNLKSNIVANVTVEPVRSEEYITELVFRVSTIQLGSTTVSSDNFFKEIRIPASVLTNNTNELKVKDFVINKASESCTITYAIAV